MSLSKYNMRRFTIIARVLFKVFKVLSVGRFILLSLAVPCCPLSDLARYDIPMSSNLLPLQQKTGQSMTLITTTDELAQFCARQKTAKFITVDTEFLREKTYWSQLCLVQIAGDDEAAAIDALAAGIDLAPLLEILQDPEILKVFHAGRQDLEIFFHISGVVPHPIFDTQVAAMVCGFGDAVSYETLAAKLAGAEIDKSARYTDWSHRPLTDRQLSYALADVTHLRQVYQKLAAKLTKTGRSHWLDGEMAILMDPATYRVDPDERGGA